MKDNIKHQIRGAFIAIPFAFALLVLAYLLTLPFQDKEPVKSELLTDLEYIEVQMDAMDGKLDLIDSLLQAKQKQ